LINVEQGDRQKIAQAMQVMTKQVGPGLAKPEKQSELRVRDWNEERVSKFHQGQQRQSVLQQGRR